MNALKHRWAVLLVGMIALAVAPYFLRLDASSIWDSNEAFYAETPREMIESGDFLNPSFNYQPRFNKPPLSYWIVASFYKVLGVSVTAERAAITLGAIAMLATAYMLARVAFSVEAGLLAALGLAASPRVLMFSRRIMIDVYLSTFMSLALVFFVLAQTRPERRRTYLALMYASIGLGVMTKGPVAALLPALAISLYLLVTRQRGEFRRLMLATGILIVVLIVVPWYAAMYRLHGWSVIADFVSKDNLSRYGVTAWGPSRRFLFYIPVLLGDLFPWSIFLLPVLWLSFARKKSQPAGAPENSPQEERLSVLLQVWAAVIVVFFSLSKSKEDLYILPAYPAAAALTAGLVSRFLARQLHRRVSITTRSMLIAGGCVLVLVGILAICFFGRGSSPYVIAGAWPIGLIAIVGGVATAVGGAVDRRRFAVVAFVGAISVSNWVFVLRTLPDFERYKPVAALCDSLDDFADYDSLIGYYNYASPSMAFYLRRRIFEYHQPDELRRALAGQRQVLCIVSENDYLALRDSLPPQTYVLASRPIFRVKLKSILDRVQPPQVLLISNKAWQSIGQ